MDAIVAVYQDWGIGAEGTQPVAVSYTHLTLPTTERV